MLFPSAPRPHAQIMINGNILRQTTNGFFNHNFHSCAAIIPNIGQQLCFRARARAISHQIFANEIAAQYVEHIYYTSYLPLYMVFASFTYIYTYYIHSRRWFIIFAAAGIPRQRAQRVLKPQTAPHGRHPWYWRISGCIIWRRRASGGVAGKGTAGPVNCITPHLYPTYKYYIYNIHTYYHIPAAFIY